MAEWLKALAWKACIRETVSWVRIPLPPPILVRRCSRSFAKPPQIGDFFAPRRAIATQGRGDFRAILTAGQLGDWKSKVATMPELIGRQFAVYPDGQVRKITSASETQVKGYGMGESVYTSSFRGDAYCVRARVKYNQPQDTNEVCTKLVKWSDHELVALDEHSGNVVQWWIERP
jgi:hypothetical protein